MRKMLGTPLRAVVVTLSVAVALVLGGGALGRSSGRSETTPPQLTEQTTAVDRLEQTIGRAQERLRRVPGDWQTWAALGMAYLERSRITTDPTYYPKAEEAVRRCEEVLELTAGTD